MNTAPVAKRVPTSRTHHGDTVIDEYAWLADRDDPDTLAYLKAENDHTEVATAHLAKLRETIFNEIKSRTQETDLSTPSRKGDWWYYNRTEEGKQYPIRCRRPAAAGETEPPEITPADSDTAPDSQEAAPDSQEAAPDSQEAAPDSQEAAPDSQEQVLLDQNAEAGESDYLALGTYTVSPDGRLLAYSTDFEGNERFTLRVKDLVTGAMLADEVPNTFYDVAWSADGSTLFYLTVDDAWRPCRVWRHRIGSPASDDVLVYEEPDERFWVGVGLTRSEALILIQIDSKLTSEVRYLPAAAPDAEPAVVQARRHGVEYAVEHQRVDGDPDGRFLILHNDQAPDFELAAAPVAHPDQRTTVIGHRQDTRLLDVDAFADHVVAHFRRDGMTGLRVIPTERGGSTPAGFGDPYEIEFDEPIHTVEPGINPEYAGGQYRLAYTSLITPASVYDYQLASRELRLRKQEPVVGYDPSGYEQHREWATAPDGTKVPISIMSRAGAARDASAPLLLYGYGSYETSMDPRFAIPRLSLVDRGFSFAIAHVRGGGEMGRDWYEQGKFGHKKNTFTDFVACAEHLVSAGWTQPERLVARGGSAGGLLMGAAANLAPEAFGAVVAEVPFVDPLNSILDPSLPLTVIEWEEWGNPLEDPSVYEYMKSYSPYENVAPMAYPPILIVTSLNDTRVLFHEPAKWIARLRATGKGGPFLMKTEMGAGHAGPSGRYDAWREQAFLLAWVLDVIKS